MLALPWQRRDEFDLAWWPTELSGRFFAALERRPDLPLEAEIRRGERVYRKDPVAAAAHYDGRLLMRRPNEPFLIAVAGRARLFAADSISAPVMADRPEPLIDVQACLDAFGREARDRDRYVRHLRIAGARFKTVIDLCDDVEARRQLAALREGVRDPFV